MHRRVLAGDRLIAAFFIGCVLFNYPLLSIFDRPAEVFNVPLLFVYSFLACKQPLNYAGYCKPEIDTLLNDARSKLTMADRLKAYEQVAAQVQKDRPIIYLYHRNWLWAYNSKLSGVREVPDGLLRVEGLKLN